MKTFKLNFTKVLFNKVAILSVAIAYFTFVGCKDKNLKTFSNCGIKMSIPASYEEKGLIVESYGSDVSAIPILMASFEYKPATSAIMEEFNSLEDNAITDETIQEYNERYLQHFKTLMMIYVLTKEDYTHYSGIGTIPNDLEKLAEKNNRVYLADILEENTDDMSEEEIALYQECRNFILSAKNKITFTKVEDDSYQEPNYPEMEKTIPKFSTTDLDGTPVTNELFASKDVTIVNVWGTFCTPCINEMPKLADWSKKLPENVQLIGLICDINGKDDAEGIKEAKDILKGADANFTNIIANGDWSKFMEAVMFIPTTFLVDKNGNVVSEPITGARVDDYKKALDNYLNAK